MWTWCYIQRLNHDRQILPKCECGMEVDLNLTDNQSPRGTFQILTAPGPGAVAVVQFTCDSVDVSQDVLRRVAWTGRPGPNMEIDRICYARWYGEDLVVVRTSETAWEVQCHGGSAAVRRICSDLLSDGLIEELNKGSGFVDCEVQEVRKSVQLSVRHCIHNAIRAALPMAGSRKTAGLILAQASNSLCDDLTLLRSAPEGCGSNAETSRQRLAKWQDVGRHLTEPWRVALIGPPNVGKSSLLNSIAGMERSIVCDQPGTTRDVVEVDAVIDGWPFRFCDTAGLRENTQDLIEEHGIRRSQLAASTCDVLCLVMDQSTDSENWIKDHIPTELPKHRIMARNKSDLLPRYDGRSVNQLPLELSGIPVIKVSAHTHDGLPDLLRWIRQAVVPEEPDHTTALPLATLPIDVVGA